MNPPSFEVSPGIGAFFAFFFMAVALWLLMRNMFKRLRRMNLAARAAELEAEEQARGAESVGPDRTGDGGSGASGAGSDSPPGSGRDGTEEGERGRDEV